MKEITPKEQFLYSISYFLNFPVLKPTFINFGLTHRCNLRCRICGTWEANPKVKDELSLQELKWVIAQTAGWGDINISFAGGEPLIRKNDLLECIKYAGKRGLTTHVTTNGMLINRRVAKEIAGSGLNYLQISIDGATRKTNDCIRGRGSFEKAMKALKCVKGQIKKLNSDLKLSLTTVVTDKNLDELLGIYKIVKDLDLHEVSYNAYTVDNSYTKDKSYEEDGFWVSGKSIQKLRKICKKLIELKKKEGRIGTPPLSLELMPEYFEKKNAFSSGLCLAGHSYMYVKPYGEVDVCGKGPSLNVRDMNIKEIWYSLTFAKTRLKIMRCKKPCLMLCFPRISTKNLLGGNH